MYAGIKPRQYVSTHKSDYLLSRSGKYYIQTFYGGRVEITKEYYEALKEKGMVER